jgi:protein TonB
MLLLAMMPVTAQQQEGAFTYVENMPVLPGGMAAIQKYIKLHLQYPSEAWQEQITGVVMVQFIVNPDQTTSPAMAISGPGFGCDEEAIRIIEAMNQNHRWIPGSHNGRIVPVSLTIPVTFHIRSAEKKKMRNVRSADIKKGRSGRTTNYF